MIEEKMFIPFQTGYFKIFNIDHRFDTPDFPRQYKGRIENIKLNDGNLEIKLKKDTVHHFLFEKKLQKKGEWVKINKKSTFTIPIEKEGYFTSYSTENLLIIKCASSVYEIFFYSSTLKPVQRSVGKAYSGVRPVQIKKQVCPPYKGACMTTL